MKTIHIEPVPDDTLNAVCEQAVRQATQEQCLVEFTFNEVPLVATPDTDPQTLADSYRAERDRRHAAYLDSPGYAQRMAEEQRKKEEKALRLAEALRLAPPSLTLRDPGLWAEFVQANSDDYGKAVIAYANTWARLMEAQLSEGKSLGEVAEDLSFLADTEGITWFMYGCAVNALSQTWAHGEALRRWHKQRA